MKRVYVAQLFEHWIDRGGGVYEDLEFENCEFFGCDISLTDDPAFRSIVRRATLRNCTFSGSRSLGQGVFEDILIENFKAPGDLVPCGAAFKHLTLRGRISRLIINNEPFFSYPWQKHAPEAFRRANLEYYESIDWALDIREARFRDSAIRLPARLIRRDPATQIIVRKSQLLANDWKRCDFKEADWIESGIQHLLDDPNRDDEVIAAPLAHPKDARKMLIVFDRLRHLGLAE